MGVDQRSYLAHKTRNRLHSTSLVAGLALLTSALGWYIGGPAGVLLLGLLAVESRPRWRIGGSWY